MRNQQKWAKSDRKLAEHSSTKGLPRENNRTIEHVFLQRMCHIISLKVTKFQQPLLITLGVADEKPEGGQKAPPPALDRVNQHIENSSILVHKRTFPCNTN